MKKNYQVLGIVAIIIIIIFAFSNSARDIAITSLGGYTDKETVTKITTEYREGITDTIAFFDRYVETKGYEIVEKKIIKKEIIKKKITKTYTLYDTIRKITTIKDKLFTHKLRHFETKFKDSLIDGVITVSNFLNGELESTSIKYKPLFPKFITRIDTIIKTIKESNTLSNKKSLFGIGAGFNNYQILSLSASYTTKNKWQFIGTLGKSFQDRKEVVNDATLFFEQKNLYGFTVLKNF